MSRRLPHHAFEQVSMKRHSDKEWRSRPPCAGIRPRGFNEAPLRQGVAIGFPAVQRAPFKFQ